jgi:hypothetical protein
MSCRQEPAPKMNAVTQQTSAPPVMSVYAARAAAASVLSCTQAIFDYIIPQESLESTGRRVAGNEETKVRFLSVPDQCLRFVQYEKYDMIFNFEIILVT